MACKQLELQRRSELPWQLVSLALVETLDAVQGWEARTDVWLDSFKGPSLRLPACFRPPSVLWEALGALSLPLK